MQKLDTFTQAYVEAALWSSTDDNDTPLDRDYSASDIAESTLARMVADCAKFQEDNAELLISEYCLSQVDNTIDGQAGHDFWLTRNHHGCGFWDGDWQEPAATKLTDAAHAFGECDLYIGDDGLIWA